MESYILIRILLVRNNSLINESAFYLIKIVDYFLALLMKPRIRMIMLYNTLIGNHFEFYKL